MKKIKAVSFDVGNTLLKAEPDVEVVYYNILREHGCRKDLHEVAEILGACLDEYERKIFKQDLDLRTDDKEEEEWWARVDAAVAKRCGVSGEHAEICKRLWDEFKKEKAWQPFPETKAVLNHLRGEGYRVGITTNWNSKLRNILRYHKLAPLLDFEVISTELGYKKPSEKVFAASLAEAGCEKEELVHVGDHLESDYQGALRAGIRAVLVDRKKQSAVEGPVISNLDQLAKLLEGEFKGLGDLL